MTQRLVGLDVNGWHDRAARNWSVDDTGAAIFDDRAAQRIDGGALSCVVLIDREDPPRPGLGSHRRRSAPGPEDAGPGTIPIGGPGARLAPHGRGDGWGERGASDRRHRLREAGGGVSDADWALAIRALGADPAIAVLAIPDLPEMTEAARERRLAALRAARARRPLLAWSSVLIALSEIEARALPAGHRLRVVEIDGDGLRSQLLTVRDGEGAAAPERREAGRRHGSGLGFAAREAAARRALIDAAAGPAGLRRAIEAADLPGRLALSAPPTALREVVLTSRQEWHELAATAPPLSAVDLDGIPLDDCDEIVVHSPGGADFNAAAAALLRGCGGPAPVRCASPWATAEGGLIAARRMTLDLPLWYDFLPAVDTIVERDGKPGGMPLVPPDAVARAGRVWRSPTPVELTWPADRDRIEVWLRKEDDPRPRRAPATVGAPPDAPRRVLLSLEQHPAQGRARLTIGSAEWPELEARPALVDWEAGEPDPRDWSTIMAELRGKPPGYPERVVLPAHAELWRATGAKSGSPALAEALARFDGRNFTPVYKALSHRLQVHRDAPGHPLQDRKFFAVDSDGGRPAGVDDGDWRALLAVVSRAEAIFVSGKAPNNHALGVLSWSFRLCPPSVWPHVAAQLMHGDGRYAHNGWWIMYPHAMGRIAGDDDAFAAAIAYLRRLPKPWNQHQQASAAFLLTRNDRVFGHLDRATVDDWANEACNQMRSARASFGKRPQHGFGEPFRYLPTLIAGLIRWRIEEPYAFLRKTDPMGVKLGAALDAVCKELARRGPAVRRHLAAYEGLRNFIDAENQRPDLLVDLFDLT